MLYVIVKLWGTEEKKNSILSTATLTNMVKQWKRPVFVCLTGLSHVFRRLPEGSFYVLWIVYKRSPAWQWQVVGLNKRCVSSPVGEGVWILLTQAVNKTSSEYTVPWLKYVSGDREESCLCTDTQSRLSESQHLKLGIASPSLAVA